MLSVDTRFRSIPISSVPQLHSGHQTIAIMKNITSTHTRKAQISQNPQFGYFYESSIMLEASLALITINTFIARQYTQEFS